MRRAEPPPQALRIVHIADGALSAAPYRLMEVQRLCGMEARLINNAYDYGRRSYPEDLLMNDDRDLLADLLERSDVIHYHNWWRQSDLFQLHPWAWDMVKAKPSVIQFHSIRLAEFEEALREPSLVKLVVAQFHVRLYPECRPVPNVVPIDDPLHRPLGRDNHPPVVGFTPSHCKRCEPWSWKGCPETLAVLRGSFRHRFITDAPWAKAMALRQVCDIAIDEVVTGSYHMCSLESLSQGLATLAGLDAQTVDALERITGTRENPWIVCRPETLHATLSQLVEDDDYRRAKRLEARRYMERFWNPAALAAGFTSVYAEARARR